MSDKQRELVEYRDPRLLRRDKMAVEFALADACKRIDQQDGQLAAQVAEMKALREELECAQRREQTARCRAQELSLENRRLKGAA